MKRSTQKSLLALLLSFILCVSILPAAVLADSGDEATTAANVTYGTYDEDGVWNPIEGDSTQYTTEDGIDLTLRKLLYTTDNEDEYEISLEIEASATVEKSTMEVSNAAVCLVLDESGSMYGRVYDSNGNYLGTRTDVLKDVAKKFIEDFKTGETGVQRLISIVGFGSSAVQRSGWVDVNTDAGYNAAIASIDMVGNNMGGTDMYMGFDIAKTLLASVPSGCTTFVVAMTDGEDHAQSTALARADDIKAGGTIIYTVGAALSDSNSSFLESVASSPDKCYMADDFTGLDEVFTTISIDISNQITSMIRNAVVTDPMAAAISVISNSNPKNFKSTDDKTYTWKLSSTTPTIEDNGTSVTYTYHFVTTYKIKVDTSADDFSDNIYHVTNEITELVWKTGKDEEGNIIEERYQFPVPSFDENEESDEECKEQTPVLVLPQPGVAILHATDSETGKPIAGLKYDLYRYNPFGGKDTKVGDTYTTKADGKITVSNATTNYYYWLAAENADGYIPDNDKHIFHITGLQFVTTEVALKPASLTPATEVEEPAISEQVEESTTVTAPALPFTDVLDNADIAFVYENGIMNGVSETLFAPDSTLTRAMIVTILYRMENEPDVAFADTFSDVEDGIWYSNAIEWAAANGIVNGYTDGSFGPNDDVTREQLAAILYRYAEMKGYSVEIVDSVEPIYETSAYALDAMKLALSVKMISESSIPTLPATRGEVALAIHVFMTTIAD